MTGMAVALLRGINVGGQHKLAMADLRSEMTEAGYEDVRTYIQSGNVVFTAGEAPEDGDAERALAAEISTVIAGIVDFDVPVVVRAGEVIGQVAESHPFAGQESDHKLLHVAFLDTEPSATADDLVSVGTTGETAEIEGRHVFLHYPEGMARSKLTGAAIEDVLGVTATMRNLRTVTQLAALASRS